MDFLLKNPSPQDFCKIYCTAYPEKSVRQLLDSIKKDLVLIAKSNDITAAAARYQLTNWQSLSNEITKIMNKPKTESNPSVEQASTIINIEDVNVRGDFIQGNVYNSTKRVRDGSSSPSKLAKQARHSDSEEQDVREHSPSNTTDTLLVSAPSDTSAPPAPPKLQESVSILDEWDWFLFASQTDADVFEYSPERHGIVVCGANIASRPGMPDSYDKLNSMLQEGDMDRSIFMKAFDAQIDYVNSIMNQTSAPSMLRAVRHLPATIPEQAEEKYYFLADIFTSIVRDIWLCKADLTSETALNVAAIFPAAKISVLDYVTASNYVQFMPGEVYLQSMASQLKNIDNYLGETNGYKADGVIRVNGINNLEIVLFETSGGLPGGSEKKRIFDFHKGMFGLVTMMKALADAFPYGTYEAISAVKMYFVHTHGTNIRVWSFAVGNPGEFRMLRVDKCLIPVDIHDEAAILGYVRLFWDLKARIKRTVQAIENLQESHRARQREYRFKEFPREKNLSLAIDPKIMKLSERTHMSSFEVDDGPHSSPPLPPFY